MEGLVQPVLRLQRLSQSQFGVDIVRQDLKQLHRLIHDKLELMRLEQFLERFLLRNDAERIAQNRFPELMLRHIRLPELIKRSSQMKVGKTEAVVQGKARQAFD